MSAKFTWTDTAVEHLRRRVAAGATSRAIAEELGTTRNAVLGMAHRLGLKWGKRQSAPPCEKRATVLDRGGVKTRIRAGVRVEVALLDDVLAMRPEAGTPLAELRRRDCRWLLRSGAPWAFCGRPAAGKRAYCEEHAARVYVPLKRGG